MAIVIKTIRGRRYRYVQHSVRVDGKVKTKSVYLGPMDPKRLKSEGIFRNIIVRRHGLPDDETMLAEFNAKVAREEAAIKAGLDKLHTDFGFKTPTYTALGHVVEIEKAPAVETIALAEPTALADKGDTPTTDEETDSESAGVV